MGQTGDNNMSVYKANITKNRDGAFYALVVRLENVTCSLSGRSWVEQVVIGHYKGRHFKTLKAAERSTQKYIEKYC